MTVQQRLLLLRVSSWSGMGVGVENLGGMRASLPVVVSIPGRSGRGLQRAGVSGFHAHWKEGRCMGVCVDNKGGENACGGLRLDKGFLTGV